ncbi:MAG: hypothetical protein JWL90_3674 [Chthoniobacteraceae bacterium]|nr:hypothetical protein [Chthoniobacteraceae bacterium]
MKSLCLCRGWIASFALICNCVAQIGVPLHEEVVALCDRPDIKGLRYYLDRSDADKVLQKWVDELPDSALDIVADILKNPKQETEQRRVGALYIATTLVRRPTVPLSRRKELEPLFIQQLQGEGWPQNHALVSAAVYGLRWVGYEDGLKALGRLLPIVGEDCPIKSVMDDIARDIPNGEKLRKAALESSTANVQKPATSSEANSTVVPISSAPLPLASVSPESPAKPPIPSSAVFVGDQTALAKRLMIPRIEMRDTWPDEVIDFLRNKSQELDPARNGVNIVAFQLPVDATVPTKVGDVRPFDAPRVTYALKNVSVFDAITQAAKLSKLKVTARKDGIFVHPAGKKP